MDLPTKISNKTVFKYLALVFVVYVILGFAYQDIILLDEFHYLAGGQRIFSEGLPDWYYPHRPIHQLFLGAIDLVLGDFLFVSRLYVALLSTFALYVIYQVFNLRLDGPSALMATLLTASSLVFISLAPTVMTGSISLFFMFLGILYYLKALQTDSINDVIASGLILGVGFLVRETVVIALIAVNLHLLIKKKWSLMPAINIAFAVPAIIYSLLFFFWGITNPWLGWLFYHSPENYARPTILLFLRYFLQYYIFTLGFIGVLGFLGLVQIMRKRRLSSLDDTSSLLIVYSVVAFLFFFVWPDIRPRFFIVFAPVLSYFVLESGILDVQKRWHTRLLYLLVIANFVAGVPIAYLYLSPHGVANDAVDWISLNYAPGTEVLSLDNRISYFLGKNGFKVYVLAGEKSLAPSPELKTDYYSVLSQTDLEEKRILAVETHMGEKIDPRIGPYEKTLLVSLKRPFPFGYFAHKEELDYWYANIYLLNPQL
ncbi:MAG: glycosyltransferase family 39 protein [Candidatus Altiarchaeota archaeon]